ncbi:TlpA family protein disulfide reductase [Micromonospora sp. CPCC 206061]|uniref:TlpA family protein disulfide reductase n=1 Tax=Micromonospora sp. CPCC 206061 TaxID=3122410 RepID=UPI002FEF3494
MPFLVTAVVLVGLLCIVDLLLTFAVLRRLREHTEELGRLSGAGHVSMGVDRDKLMGRELPEFSAITVDGAVVSRESLTGAVELVGIFSPGCSPCHAQAPLFVAEAARMPAGKTLALVAGSGAEADDLVQIVKGMTDVVLAPESMTVVNGLNIGAFPTFLRLDASGAIVDAAVSVQGLAELSRS